jgi:hypothetical protein
VLFITVAGIVIALFIINPVTVAWQLMKNAYHWTGHRKINNTYKKSTF